MTTTENEDDHGASSCKVDSIQAPDIRQNYEIPDFEIFKKCMSVKTCVVRNTSADSNDAKTADLIDLNKSIDSEKDEVKADSDDFDVSKLNQELERIEVRLRKEIAEQPLPKDWERYEDDQGPYYWHVPR